MTRVLFGLFLGWMASAYAQAIVLLTAAAVVLILGVSVIWVLDWVLGGLPDEEY